MEEADFWDVGDVVDSIYFSVDFSEVALIFGASFALLVGVLFLALEFPHDEDLGDLSLFDGEQ